MSTNTLQETKQKANICIRKTSHWPDTSKVILQKNHFDLSRISHVEDCEDAKTLSKTCCTSLRSTKPLRAIYCYSFSD